MKTYIFTRFAIFDPSAKFSIYKKYNGNSSAIKDALFNPNRLDKKFDIFERVTYYSVKRQTNQNFKWYILTSNQLPSKYKDKLYSFETNNIKIHEVSNFKEFFEFISNYQYDTEFSTIRLDNDDGLRIDYVDKINNAYKNSTKKNEVFSPMYCKKVKVINGDLYVETQDSIPYKTAASGLAKFQGDIHLCGPHTQVPKKYTVIYDSSPEMYYLNADEICDSNQLNPNYRTFDFKNSIKKEVLF